MKKVYDTGEWKSLERRPDTIISSDFTHDATLQVTGDFEDCEQCQQYIQHIASRLNISRSLTLGSFLVVKQLKTMQETGGFPVDVLDMPTKSDAWLKITAAMIIAELDRRLDEKED